MNQTEAGTRRRGGKREDGGAADGTLLFLGPELGEKQAAVEELRRRLGKECEETSFYAGETSVAEMVSFLQNGALFAETRLVFIKNADLIKKKDEVELLASYIKAPMERTALVLEAEASSLARGLEAAVAPERKRVFWELFENRKQEWVKNFFKQAGFAIQGDGVEAVLELVENNTAALRQECGRLAAFLDKTHPIGAEEVEKWLAHTRAESAFTLFSRIAEGDLGKSLETLHALLRAKEPPIAVFAGLAWCFRRLRDYAALATDEGALRKAGFAAPKLRKDYEAAFRRYGAGAAEFWLALTAEFDLRIRQAGADCEALLMEFYLYKLCFPSYS